MFRYGFRSGLPKETLYFRSNILTYLHILIDLWVSDWELLLAVFYLSQKKIHADQGAFCYYRDDRGHHVNPATFTLKLCTYSGWPPEAAAVMRNSCCVGIPPFCCCLSKLVTAGHHRPADAHTHRDVRCSMLCAASSSHSHKYQQMWPDRPQTSALRTPELDH